MCVLVHWNQPCVQLNNSVIEKRALLSCYQNVQTKTDIKSHNDVIEILICYRHLTHNIVIMSESISSNEFYSLMLKAIKTQFSLFKDPWMKWKATLHLDNKCAVYWYKSFSSGLDCMLKLTVQGWIACSS